jgi:hypothetical protein
MIPKRKPFRSRKLLDLAHKVNECQVRIPGVCIGYSVHGCEPAHSNQAKHGKGAGQKADDNRHVAACHPCHVAIDQGPMPKAEKVRLWDAAFERTRALYMKLFGVDLEGQ